MITVPQLPGITDLVALQNAITLILLSEDRLTDVPVLPEIRLHQESELFVDALWTLSRNAVNVSPTVVEIQGEFGGKTGAGLLVEMPAAISHSPGVTGPPLTWEVGIVSFEERNINFTPVTGVGIMAEQLSQIVLDTLHLLSIRGFGVFQAASRVIAPAQDWMSLKPGIFAYRTIIQATIARPQTARSKIATATFSGGLCTITCADPDATIIFTTDNTTPVKANVNAVPYTVPFPVTSGQIVLTGTWTPERISSEILGFTAP